MTRIKFIKCERETVAQNRAFWAKVLVKIQGGFLAFETTYAYNRWKADPSALSITPTGDAVFIK
ncbi:hypothetical protein KL86DPRO_30146 [uncultured delta proteobacterium]|mgnify:CR=1|uniref:Uncharacterized protein n=1 Tax=uncultured delta proteobacterium TaxID=34034 RepID=A0A212K8I6_9DELT|nr:hypothetical protein KL86DPRO_30146 [uncultured delta proteobacterium]